MAIDVSGLTKSYGQRRAIDALDLQVEGGSVVGFLGPNGAGKTTLIRVLSTMLQADRGSFTVAGIPHTNPVEIRRRVGVLPESAGYLEGQTGEETLVFHARLFGVALHEAHRRAAALLAEVGLADRAQSLVRSYSRGMRQRLGIARALVSQPEVLFLDEPTLGLDPAGQRQVLGLVAAAARGHGVTVMLSTHLLAEVEEVCDRVVILNQGRVVADGTVREVAERASAPRHATIRVAPGSADAAMAALASLQDLSTVSPGVGADELILELADRTANEADGSRVLRTLLDAGVPIVAFDLEGGRLSDAFLALTAPT